MGIKSYLLFPLIAIKGWGTTASERRPPVVRVPERATSLLRWLELSGELVAKTGFEPGHSPSFQLPSSQDAFARPATQCYFLEQTQRFFSPRSDTMGVWESKLIWHRPLLQRQSLSAQQ
ncbi:UNVERIFIED_CONTAM: hypothetical protein K2H54_009078 [Gekko kuhli]